MFDPESGDMRGIP